MDHHIAVRGSHVPHSFPHREAGSRLSLSLRCNFLSQNPGCILLQPCLTHPCEMRFGQWHVHSVSKFPGEPIEIYKVFELLLGSRDQLRRIRHGICDVKDDDAGSAWCRMPGFPSLNTVPKEVFCPCGCHVVSSAELAARRAAVLQRSRPYRAGAKWSLSCLFTSTACFV